MRSFGGRTGDIDAADEQGYKTTTLIDPQTDAFAKGPGGVVVEFPAGFIDVGEQVTVEIAVLEGIETGSKEFVNVPEGFVPVSPLVSLQVKSSSTGAVLANTFAKEVRVTMPHCIRNAHPDGFKVYCMRDGGTTFNKLEDPLPFRSADFARSAVFATNHFSLYQIMCDAGLASCMTALMPSFKELELAVMEHDGLEYIAVVLRALEGGVCTLETKMEAMIEVGWRKYPYNPLPGNQLEFPACTNEIEFSLETDSHEVLESEKRSFPYSRTSVVKIKRPPSDSELVLHVRPVGGEDVDTYPFKSSERGGGGGGAAAAAIGAVHVPAATSTAADLVCAAQVCPFSNASVASQDLLQLLHKRNIKDWTRHQVASFLLFEAKINKTFVKYLHNRIGMVGAVLMHVTITYLKTLPHCPEEPTLFRLLDMVAQLKGAHGSESLTEDVRLHPDMLLSYRQRDPVRVAKDDRGGSVQSLLKLLKPKYAASPATKSKIARRLKLSADQALTTLGEVSDDDAKKFGMDLLEQLQGFVSKAAPAGSDKPLHARLESVKLVLSQYIHTPLRFCSWPIRNKEIVLQKLTLMVLEPAIICMQDEIARMAAQVNSAERSWYEGKLVELSKYDKVIYEAEFSKRTELSRDNAKYESVLLAIGDLKRATDESNPPARVQPERGMLQLACMCRNAIPEFEKVVRALFGSIVAEKSIQFRHEIKALYRMAEKALMKGPQSLTKGGGGGVADCSKICDIVGCLIVCDDFAVMERAVNKLTEAAHASHVYEVKSRWKTPSPGGWRDLICLLGVGKPGNQIVCEIQIVLDTMIVARQGLGAHKAYAEYRSYSEMLTYVDALGDAGSSCGGGAATAVLTEREPRKTVSLPAYPLTPANSDV